MQRFLPITLPAVVTIALCACSPSAPKPAAPAAAPSSAPATSSLVVGKAPAASLVTLEPVNGVVPPPEGGALLDQFSKQFVPETLFVRVGQEVTFRNSEDQLHNVTVVGSRTGTAVFDISQNPFDTFKHTFDRAGEFDVTCDVHPGMRATIVATNTPHAMYADNSGSFQFANVIPGSYTLRISKDGRQSERVVDVSGARTEIASK